MEFGGRECVLGQLYGEFSLERVISERRAGVRNDHTLILYVRIERNSYMLCPDEDQDVSAQSRAILDAHPVR